MKYLKVFTDFLDVTAQLSDGAMGRLFRAMLRYARDGAEPELPGSERFLWLVAKQHIDREADAYREKVNSMERARKAKNQAEIKQRSTSQPLISTEDKDKYNDKYKNNDNSISFPPSPSAEKKETHPSLEEVTGYVRETFLPVDPEHFYNYYEANGWQMGQNPIRDWKAALRAWARNAPVAPRPVKKPSTLDNFREAMEMIRMQEAKPVSSCEGEDPFSGQHLLTNL